MTEDQRKKLGKLPTLHTNCIKWCGVARPGKTLRDRLKRENKTHETENQQASHGSSNRAKNDTNRTRSRWAR
jgi:hypothetical protein